MTNEEKAMKDYNRYLKIKDKIKDREDRAFLIDFLLNEGYKKGLAEGRKEGYEQGYEDCRHYAHDYYKPKWHEIKCCSQDLPSRSKDNYLHSVIVSNEYGEPIYYDYNIDEWCDMEGDVVNDGCKHWCELPKFEKKK